MSAQPALQVPLQGARNGRDEGERRAALAVKQATDGGLGNAGIMGETAFALEGVAAGMSHQSEDAVMDLRSVDFGDAAGTGGHDDGSG